MRRERCKSGRPNTTRGTEAGLLSIAEQPQQAQEQALQAPVEGNRIEIGMDATAEIQYEPISGQKQRECWQEFCKFHAATVNAKFAVEAGVPVPTVASSQPVSSTWVGKDKNGGWTTEFTVTAADVDDGSDDGTEEVDGADKRRWLKAIFSLLGGSSHAVAAKEADVSNRQLSRWKRDPQFVELYQKTKAEVFRDSVNGMKGVLTAAGIVGAKALQQIAEDSKASDTARVAAARALTQLALEINDLESNPVRYLL